MFKELFRRGARPLIKDRLILRNTSNVLPDVGITRDADWAKTVSRRCLTSASDARPLLKEKSILRNASNALRDVGNRGDADWSKGEHAPPMSFEDFLLADTNKDGRVSSAEWETFVKLKRKQETDSRMNGLTIHVPISPLLLKSIVESEGFGVTINGVHYSVNLQPEGDSLALIKKRTDELESIKQDIWGMEKMRAPLDAAAARHTRRVMSSILIYLLLQAGVVAKLTFFSRFGWDVMEPVTYFITFGISLVGLTFFTWNRLEFSYPALAALIARRRAQKLYKKHGFDEERLSSLFRDRDRIQKQLDAMMPVMRSFEI